MRNQRLITTLGVALFVAACTTGISAPQPAASSAGPGWPAWGYFPTEAKPVHLVIEQPPKSWGPVTVVTNDGRLPVRLSQEGVDVEAVGSSTPPQH
ncbi:MAG TPA: hypothetical protein VLV50_01525 [Stellaceae bacterium]|nr:hypothetical protein [Stellaceae bacterium]